MAEDPGRLDGDALRQKIKDAIDDVLQWRDGADQGDYPFGWPDMDYDMIADGILPLFATTTRALQEARQALQEIEDEALNVMDPPIEEETICFGNLVHILRICQGVSDDR